MVYQTTLLSVLTAKIIDKNTPIAVIKGHIERVSSFLLYTGWPKKVRHCQESSLNCIKNIIKGIVFNNFDHKMSKRM